MYTPGAMLVRDGVSPLWTSNFVASVVLFVSAVFVASVLLTVVIAVVEQSMGEQYPGDAPLPCAAAAAAA